MPDMLSAELIREQLTFPAEVFVHDVLDSTNNTAKTLAQNGAAHGSMVLAEQQTAGRGRSTHSFMSPPGTGLYCSIIVKELTVTDAARITCAAAVGVRRAILAHCGVACDIKWVNDLMMGGKKLCGILAEAVTDPHTGALVAVIIGIGININEPYDGFPDEIAEIATVLSEYTPVAISRNTLAAAIASEVLTLCEQLPNDDFMEEYITANIVPGHAVWVLQNGEKTAAHALGITQEGFLRVRYENGQEALLHFGEVSVRVQEEPWAELDT